MHAAELIKHIRNPPDERQVFVELTERGKSLEDRAACLGPAVFGDIGIRSALWRMISRSMSNSASMRRTTSTADSSRSWSLTGPK
jgi:DNA-binding MarR family transcriptional regulator